jgi:hypothetical protein
VESSTTLHFVVHGGADYCGCSCIDEGPLRLLLCRDTQVDVRKEEEQAQQLPSQPVESDGGGTGEVLRPAKRRRWMEEGRRGSLETAVVTKQWVLEQQEEEEELSG